MQVRRLVEAFNEPFRKVLRTMPLALPSSALLVPATQSGPNATSTPGPASSAAVPNNSARLSHSANALGQLAASANSAVLGSNADHGSVSAEEQDGGSTVGCGVSRHDGANADHGSWEHAFFMTQAELPREREDEDDNDDDEGFYGS